MPNGFGILVDQPLMCRQLILEVVDPEEQEEDDYEGHLLFGRLDGALEGELLGTGEGVGGVHS
jgi:hypothetical protein